jgi:hypothetical protein
MAAHNAPSKPAVTYTPAGTTNGPTFTCPRCERVYPYPVDHGPPVRCECGWWYTNLGHGRIVEEFRPRIGGASTKGPEAAAGPATGHQH